MSLVYTCPPANFDAQTGECSAGAWVEHSDSLLPELSIADAYTLSSAVFVLWGIAYGWRVLIRFVRQS